MTEYEFDSNQNEVLENLSNIMSFVAIFLIVLGTITGLSGLATIAKGGIANLFTAVIYIVIGAWTKKAATSFKMIVDTEGSDISNLMNALNQLKNLYSLQYFLMIILIVIIIFGVVITLSVR